MENQSDIPEDLKNHVRGFLGGMMVGSLAGAVTMLLVAPQSGKRTRAKIQQRSIELRDQAANTIEDVLAETRDKALQIRKNVNDQTEVIQQRGQDLLEAQKERVSTLVEAGTKAIQGVLGSHSSAK